MSPTTDPRILLIFAHPTPHRSRANRLLREAAASLPNVRVHDLYETYPDFHIDVPAEQELLAAADLVVFQHPIRWYSMPALLKEWVDAVYEHGWAYGEGGNALRDKDCWMVVTTGGSEDAYQENGHHGHPFETYLPPFEQTARLCGMNWLPPLVLHGVGQASDAELARQAGAFRDRLASYPSWSGHGLPITAREDGHGK
ncbi:Kef-type potassium/proton antiporter accessory protein, CPA2 family [Noviherbaspirillum humi]|uniref:Kef-type potassium/proton antiporter accessory protein, CPA2 family n=1 Tax=Noviherbaspirillum humi TaxID=1688639 RepID=A0A239H5I1_9BURK|nr:NAD(P)H-dependent oxidoreductase [Noviherbaspirillum humi]SNS76706.1 Kef-type potassium/proton antiporter accessory protein, CPA2 family [Noviherbaspirillum humi]